MIDKITNSKRLNILGNAAASSNCESLTEGLKLWRQKLGYFSVFAALPAVMGSQLVEVRADDSNVLKADRPLRGPGIGTVKTYGKRELLRRQSNFRLPHQQGQFDMVSAFTGGDDCPGTIIPPGTYTSASPYLDTANTTGANNTINTLAGSFYYYYYSVSGPDLVYTFTLNSRGPQSEIRITPNSGTYDPAIYILDDRNGQGCPTGTGNVVYSYYFWDAGRAGSPEIINSEMLSYLPLNVPLHLFVDSEAAASANNGPYTITMKDVTLTSGTSGRRTKLDFDGDGRADLAVFRPSDRVWYVAQSAGGSSEAQFGLASDKIVPADFDGDGKTDIAIYRDGTWWRINSSDGSVSVNQFGLSSDVPVPADYTGDGRAELAVYRDGIWWMLDLSNNQVSVVQFGLAGDKPVPADYDGDGRVDQAVYRGNGEWHLNRSTQGYTVVQFGLASDKPVVGDYDGDGKADLAVYRDGTWWVQSANSSMEFQFGLSTDIPAPADYDGDGRTDAAIYRNGQWWLRQSSKGIAVQQFGLANDKPAPSAYLP